MPDLWPREVNECRRCRTYRETLRVSITYSHISLDHLRPLYRRGCGTCGIPWVLRIGVRHSLAPPALELPGELGHSNPVKPRSFISSVSPHSSTAHSVKWIRLIVLR